jgi:hypothetical protein
MLRAVAHAHTSSAGHLVSPVMFRVQAKPGWESCKLSYQPFWIFWNRMLSPTWMHVELTPFLTRTIVYKEEDTNPRRFISLCAIFGDMNFGERLTVTSHIWLYHHVWVTPSRMLLTPVPLLRPRPGGALGLLMFLHCSYDRPTTTWVWPYSYFPSWLLHMQFK